jgi:signal-transduction protein with cAMP-binding, CBS, and nucleotidyltransferase domain
MNDIIIKEESTTEYLYIIIQGQVDCIKNSKNNLG